MKSVHISTACCVFSFQWRMSKTVDRAMARWHIDDDTIKNWSIDDAIKHSIIAMAPSRHRHRTIPLSLSYHRVVALSFYCAIAPSSSYCRAIASSFTHRRFIVIAPSHYWRICRWCDDAILNYIFYPDSIPPPINWWLFALVGIKLQILR